MISNSGYDPADGAAGERPVEPIWRLRLYVVGAWGKSRQAIENVHRLCDEHLAGRYDLTVIDLLRDPQLAREDQVVAAPTLVRHAPAPVRKVIGDLSNLDRIFAQLQLPASSPASG